MVFLVVPVFVPWFSALPSCISRNSFSLEPTDIRNHVFQLTGILFPVRPTSGPIFLFSCLPFFLLVFILSSQNPLSLLKSSFHHFGDDGDVPSQQPVCVVVSVSIYT